MQQMGSRIKLTAGGLALGTHGGVRLTGGGALLPFSDDFARADGDLGGRWLAGSNWQIVSGKAVNTPSLGAELLTNGNMETGDPPGSWTAANGAILTSVADERTGGTGSASLNAAQISLSSIVASQTQSLPTGTWYSGSAWIKNVDATNAYLQVQLGLAQNSGVVSATNWTKVIATTRVAGSDQIRLVITGSSNQARFDDVSLKALTLATLFQVINVGTPNVDVSAAATIVAGTQAGVVVNLDSITNPLNGIIGHHDGTVCKLEKMVNGVYTTLVSATTAYVANVVPTVRRVKGTNTRRLFYNGVQIGTDQIIDDAAINAGTLAGMFSTYEGNLFTSCTFEPSVPL